MMEFARLPSIQFTLHAVPEKKNSVQTIYQCMFGQHVSVCDYKFQLSSAIQLAIH